MTLTSNSTVYNQEMKEEKSVNLKGGTISFSSAVRNHFKKLAILLIKAFYSGLHGVTKKRTNTQSGSLSV